ncbi:hypothetical protein QA640_42600 [Bradyrhizobium sp. CB82]|uniref:hypothetical protein n=1 Tax=Bradyrhizobium sp. CB82 TaxID=3039159 RepID=UPI0024B27F61|nr:hypothetical protein [Bradyrhizobium sp. CB82]WFU40774.1 hypothetical protein QA640_42600 [Bradyrhizobium sp. CB82]
MVAKSIDALLEAELIPCALSTNAKSLAADGATILMAIGSQQPNTTAIARVTTRFGCMDLQAETGGQEPSRGVADIFPSTKSISFGTDLAELLLNLWKAAHQSSTSGFTGVGVSMLWNDVQGSVLFGVIEEPVGRRKRVYATEAFRIPSAVKNEWDFVQLPTTGGIKYAPRSILRFGALLDSAVSSTAARLDR